MASAEAKGKPPPAALVPRPAAFRPYSGARKLVIKNLRPSSARESQVEEYYARTEKDLDAALAAVFVGEAPAVPLEKLYRGVEDVCRKGNADRLYALLKEKADKHLQRVVLPRIQRNMCQSNIENLRTVLSEWKTWNTQTVGAASLRIYYSQTDTPLDTYPFHIQFS